MQSLTSTEVKKLWRLYKYIQFPATSAIYVIGLSLSLNQVRKIHRKYGRFNLVVSTVGWEPFIQVLIQAPWYLPQIQFKCLAKDHYPHFSFQNQRRQSSLHQTVVL